MSQFELYILLLAIIVITSAICNKISAPTPLMLVIVGMLISFIPDFPTIILDPGIVFNVFLPLLVYQSSAFISWRDIKHHKRPIALLSIGHVIFITIVVAITAHAIIPEFSWPMAFVLGAVVSPPDDIAIIALAEKVYLPHRLRVILAGESLLNDATALILFRFSLAALITNYFLPMQALSNFILIVVCETAYGLALGHLFGTIRLKLNNPMLEMLISLLTPFIAYLPAIYFGGSGVLATVVTGLVIGHLYNERFSPNARLLWLSVWQTISFSLSSILFILVGLKFRSTLQNISAIPMTQLLYYSTAITLVVIIGRFIWVYPAAYIPRYLFPSIRKNDPGFNWKLPFIASWAGMRGAVSLAVALIIPPMSIQIGNADLRDLIIFLVFCIIIATLLLQGLTLPWIMKLLGIDRVGSKERSQNRHLEIEARLEMANAVLRWLEETKSKVKDDPDFLEDVRLQILEYHDLRKHLKQILENFDEHYAQPSLHRSATHVFRQVIEIERVKLSELWHAGKITHSVRNKLLEQLDLRAKRFSL